MRCFYVWYIQKYGCLMSEKCRVNRFRPDGGKRGIISATLFLSRPPPPPQKIRPPADVARRSYSLFLCEKRCKNTLHLSMSLFRQCGIAQIPDIPSVGV